MTTMKTASTLALLTALVLPTLPAAAQDAASDCPPTRSNDKQLGIFLSELRACNGSEEAKLVTGKPLAAERAEQMVPDMPAAADATSGFAGRVRDGLTDFLPLFNLGGDALVRRRTALGAPRAELQVAGKEQATAGGEVRR